MIYKYGSGNSKKKLTKEQQLWLLNNHPIFTGVCRNCGYQYNNTGLYIGIKSKHWNCPECNLTYIQS